MLQAILADWNFSKMKILYTSDLHVDISENNRKILDCLVEYMIIQKPDLFIIAGDLANSSKDINDSLKRFKFIDCKKVFIPGNHDLWVESKSKLKRGFDSSYKYEVELPQTCFENNFIYPINEPYIFENVAVVGTVGWYDYSLRDQRLDMKYQKSDYDVGEFGNMYWSDFTFSAWLVDRNNSDWKARKIKMKNHEVFQKVYKQFNEVFLKLASNISNIILAMHTAPHENCLIRKDEPDPFDAYEGSDKYLNYLENNLNNRKVLIICGHKHKKLDITINPSIRIVRAPFGYLNYEVENINQLFLDKIGLISI
jgi:predicted phosphohydrolase